MLTTPLALLTLALTAAPPLQVDLHLDTPTQLHRKGLPLDAPSGLEAGLPQLRAGGTTIAVEVLWPPRNEDWVAHTERLLTILEGEIARLDEVVLVRDAAEARAASDAGQIGVLVALEGAHGLGEGDDWAARLQGLSDRGLSVLGVTWSFSNRFAGSSGESGGGDGTGLTDEGRALLAEAARLQLVLDVSHADRAATMAICQASTAPVIASHSDARGVTANPRNLTDEEIRCIAETGGVIGLNFHAPFVGASADVSRVADHADHLARIGGHGVVGLGSDFDGMIRVPSGLEDASKLGALWTELERRG